MLSEHFICIGPGKTLAYIRGDLRTATESFLVIGPWLDDYVAEQMVLIAPRTLKTHILIRPEQQVESYVWTRMMAALSICASHWTDFEARTLAGLHAKCACIDNQVVFIGSANWYRYSLEQSLEVVLRGPLNIVQGLDRELKALWDQGELLTIVDKSLEIKVPTATGITNEVIDPIAAKVLKENPKAFRLGKKKRGHL